MYEAVLRAHLNFSGTPACWPGGGVDRFVTTAFFPDHRSRGAGHHEPGRGLEAHIGQECACRPWGPAGVGPGWRRTRQWRSRRPWRRAGHDRRPNEAAVSRSVSPRRPLSLAASRAPSATREAVASACSSSSERFLCCRSFSSFASSPSFFSSSSSSPSAFPPPPRLGGGGAPATAATAARLNAGVALARALRRASLAEEAPARSVSPSLERPTLVARTAACRSSSERRAESASRSKGAEEPVEVASSADFDDDAPACLASRSKTAAASLHLERSEEMSSSASPAFDLFWDVRVERRVKRQR